jgi:hypothetical protein
VDVWGTSIGIIERANPHEADSGSGLRVVAPDGNLAGRAARDLLASSAGWWRIDDFGLARSVHDSIRLVEGVKRVGCTGLALAPATVAGVDDERGAYQSISDLAARASAFHGGPPTNDGSNAKTIAELTYGSNAALRQHILDTLTREISEFESEFANTPASDIRHWAGTAARSIDKNNESWPKTSAPVGSAPTAQGVRHLCAGFMPSVGVLDSSCPGLTRASIKKSASFKRMDCRVKPGNDGG